MKGKETYIVVYPEKSVLVMEDGAEYTFSEGKQSKEANARYLSIRKHLSEGFLENVIEEAIQPGVKIEGLTPEQTDTINGLVDSVTSEVGRAIVGLTVMQLTIKSIEPKQSVRLHKSSGSSSAFSWQEGVPMRVLDSNFITPALRKYGLLKLNSFGFMMTRSLAENYPYSRLYKAAIRGAKEEWMKITDWLEGDQIDGYNGLKQMLAALHNKSEEFNDLSEETLGLVNSFISTKPNQQEVLNLISEYIDSSTYSARLFEVSMHSLFQAFEEYKVLEGFLKPLSQMRSANKKHGNIGDIEITTSKDSLSIIEAWDAKFGKTYLRDELEELNDKLALHSESEIVGFVTDQSPNLKSEINIRLEEIKQIHQVEIQILKFDDWVNSQILKYQLDSDKISHTWLIALAESICQRRREQAPIDEPTYEWVKELHDILTVKLR